MVTTGAKGSTVNQSQVSCALGQQALEGRRVPRMSSGRTMPSFAPYDPNPRADGFIADRFLTGIRPQEYYFHCMAGREGLVDTAVKTSRSGYLQRCLVKHLEELKVCYDHTVRDGEGGVVQFLYGEDGIDPTKAAHLDGSSSTLQYMARNYKSLENRHVALPGCTLDIAESDSKQITMMEENDEELYTEGAFVLARKLRFGQSWIRGSLCRGWFAANITRVYPDRKHFDIKYCKDGSVATRVPVEVEFDYSGGRHTRAVSSTCILIKPGAPDPILSDISKERGGHRIGSSGACVSEHIASKVKKAVERDRKLKTAMKSVDLSSQKFKEVVAAKYSSALCAPGEAVGCIAAQSIGEPSTQMTLNTFHLAGAGANVTLGIPRLREIIMTASRELKTPTMSVPLLPYVTEKEAIRLTRDFTRLSLSELIANRGGITVRETLQQSPSGSWERAYYVTLTLQSEERIREAFGLALEDVAAIITSKFFPTLSRLMKDELKRSNSDGMSSLDVLGGAATEFVNEKVPKSKVGNVMDDDDEDKPDDDEDDTPGDEDGVNASRYGAKQELTSYGDMDDEDEEIVAEQNRMDFTNENNAAPQPVTDDEGASEDEEMLNNMNTVQIVRKRNALVLQPLRVDPSNRPLLMVGLVEIAASRTLVRSRPKIEAGFINEEKENDRGRCLQTAGCNFSEIWKLNQVDHNRLSSNDIWAVRCAYGVEAARMSIVDQIRGVFAVYGIQVDMRHLTLIADYMTYDGEYKPMNRIGMADASSSFLQMSFETTANFMIDAAMNNKEEAMMSPSANIVLGRPIRHGTGAFECLVK